MTCAACRDEPVAHPDATLCESCRYAELVGLIQRRRLVAQRGLPPSLCFLLNVLAEAGWPERAVTSAQHALMRPETAVPAVFAHLMEADA